MLFLNLLVFLLLLPICCILYFRANNPLPNKILAILLFLPSCGFLANASNLSGFVHKAPLFAFLVQGSSFFFAPLAYNYVLLLTTGQPRKNHPLYWVTGACVLLSLYYGIRFLLWDDARQAGFLSRINSHDQYPFELEITSDLFIVLQLVYFSLASLHIYRFRKQAPNFSSSYERIRAAFVTRFMILLWILTLVTFLLYASLPVLKVEYIALPIVVSLIFYFIIYYGFHYNSIFTPSSYQSFLEHTPVVPAIGGTEKELSGNDRQEMERIIRQADAYLNSSEAYTDPELTLNALAGHLNLPVRKLSAAINNICGQNFYEMINSRRVSKAVELLRNHPGYTIEAIGRESGFNSRSAFYRAFKKQTGKNPAEFLQNPS